MTQLEIKPQTLIRAKGFDISIGRERHQIALISQSSGEFADFKSIRKGGRLAKAKRAFKSKLSSTTAFFFEGMSIEDIEKLIKMFK